MGKIEHHKTSMLQDLEASNPLKLDSIEWAIIELGNKLGLAIPHTGSINEKVNH